MLPHAASEGLPARSALPARLRNLLSSPDLLFLMEAHDGLSARIADAAGFRAIWASGLSISTSLGLRDSDEASWSQTLSVVDRIVEASSAPVVVDGDTGYGNFNSARRFFRQAERLGASAVCFEDKVFPKINSFVGDNHQLATVTEFTGKLRACLDSRTNDDFCLIARTEALIAGRSVEEALERAAAYADAGADAIFVHSRSKSADQIEEFATQWNRRLPLVIAPTTYAETPSDRFRRMGVSGVIWANQSMRAAFSAMHQVCRQILESEGVQHVEARLASLDEIFELLRYEELAADERCYAGSAQEQS